MCGGLQIQPSRIMCSSHRTHSPRTGETGQQLLLLDGAVGREPLMVRISSGVFLDALRLFRSCLLYANALNDRTVPYHSASIHLSDVYYLHTPYKV